MDYSLYIARHGETTANLRKEIVGVTDVNLTSKGFSDAHIIGNNIPSNVHLIISSPQLRGTITSDILRKYNNAVVIEHPILHPQNFGIIEGLTLDEAREKGLGHNLHTQETNKYIHKADGGESAKEMENRTIPQIDNLIKLTKSKSINIVLLTHNSISRCLLGNMNNQSPEEWIENNIANTSIIKVTGKNVNSINHLDYSEK